MTFLIAHKYGFQATRATFCPFLRRDNGEALAPPDAKMREIGFNAFHDLKRHGRSRESRHW